MKRQFRYILLLLTAAGIFNVSLALGAAITVNPDGGGGFTIQGDNLNGVAGAEITVGYDSSKLASPSIRWGSVVSGALSIANTSIPGSIKIAIVKHEPFVSSSGPIATILFATHNSDCGISSVSAKLIDASTAHVPVQAGLAAGAACAAASDQVLISTPGVPFSQSTTTSPIETSTTSTATTSNPATSPQVPMGIGTIDIPSDNKSRKEEKALEAKVVSQPEPAEKVEAASQQVKQASPEIVIADNEPVSVKQMVYGSVLDRFQRYQGEKTPDILIALFTKDISPNVRQEPPVVVSDGNSKVRVSVDLTAIKGTSANFALTGAKLVSLKGGDESGKWVLDVLPQANTLKAVVTIMNSRANIDYPLTVVPPSGAITGKKADFEVFLKDSGAKVPKFDLNGDGRHDYLDDYIYTAHFLIASSAAAKSAK